MYTEPDGEGNEEEDSRHTPDAEMFAQEHRDGIDINERPYTQPGENNHHYAVHKGLASIAHHADEPRGKNNPYGCYDQCR